MPKLVGSSTTVVDHEGLVIDELAGNVATSEDTISIANVTVSEPTAEPWLTLDYDEWMCMRKGIMEIHFHNDSNEPQVLTVKPGDTVFIGKGERFRPVFPEGNTEYIPVCLPAFTPDRCHREEGDTPSDVSEVLNALHGKGHKPSPTASPDDVLYHMCQKDLWEEAVKSRSAYYAPTFEADGNFTHATKVPQRLIETANHFYTSSEGDWICLELSRSALTRIGIVTKDEAPMPVGETDTSEGSVDKKWICPHIYGGIPTLVELGVLTNVYPMIRSEDGTFLNISVSTDGTK